MIIWTVSQHKKVHEQQKYQTKHSSQDICFINTFCNIQENRRGSDFGLVWSLTAQSTLIKFMSSQSVYLTTLFLGRLSPLCSSQFFTHSFIQKLITESMTKENISWLLSTKDCCRMIMILIKLINKRAKMALYLSPDYQTSFESIGLSFQEKNFQYRFSRWWLWWHSWISNQNDFKYFWSTNHLDTAKFWVNWPFGSGEKVKLEQPSWIYDQNDFNYFWSTSHPDTFYQVSSQLASQFKRSSI